MVITWSLLNSAGFYDGPGCEFLDVVMNVCGPKEERKSAWLITRRITQSSSSFFFFFQRKCDQYWPERGTRNYGQVQVTLKETLNMSHYTVRKLVMTHKMVSYRVLTILQSRNDPNLLDCRQQVFSLRVRRVFIDDGRERKRVVWENWEGTEACPSHTSPHSLLV